MEEQFDVSAALNQSSLKRLRSSAPALTLAIPGDCGCSATVSLATDQEDKTMIDSLEDEGFEIKKRRKQSRPDLSAGKFSHTAQTVVSPDNKAPIGVWWANAKSSMTTVTKRGSLQAPTPSSLSNDRACFICQKVPLPTVKLRKPPKSSLLNYFAISSKSMRSDRVTTPVITSDGDTSLKKCSFCDRKACHSCRQTCEVCNYAFCSLCTTTDYTGREERIYCLDCQYAASRESAISSMAMQVDE